MAQPVQRNSPTGPVGITSWLTHRHSRSPHTGSISCVSPSGRGNPAHQLAMSLLGLHRLDHTTIPPTIATPTTRPQSPHQRLADRT